MDDKYLNYILAMSEHKNMTKAAESLYVSQSALSQYLLKLENDLGTPLFLRTKGELSLTPAGELYVQTAKKILKLQRDLYRDIKNLDKKGHITIAVTSTFGMRLLSETVPIFKKEYPGYRIVVNDVNLPTMRRMITYGKADMGIGSDVTLEPFKENAVILRYEDILLAIPASHPYASVNTSDTITVDDAMEIIANNSLVAAGVSSALQGTVNDLLRSRNVTPSTVMETDHVATIRSMIANQGYIGFLGESCTVERQYIKYYYLDPTIKRMNILYCREDWVRKDAENRLYELITDYFNNVKEKPFIAEHYAGITGKDAFTVEKVL